VEKFKDEFIMSTIVETEKKERSYPRISCSLA
jgi:hypothetical protein